MQNVTFQDLIQIGIMLATWVNGLIAIYAIYYSNRKK